MSADFENGEELEKRNVKTGEPIGDDFATIMTRHARHLSKEGVLWRLRTRQQGLLGLSQTWRLPLGL